MATIKIKRAYEPEEKTEDFKSRYNVELLHSPVIEYVSEQLKKHKILTLVYSAKDEQHNQAIVIKEFLEKKIMKL